VLLVPFRSSSFPPPPSELGLALLIDLVDQELVDLVVSGDRDLQTVQLADGMAGSGRPRTTAPCWSTSTRSSPRCRRCTPREPAMPDRVDRLREAAQARHEATLRHATNSLQRFTAAAVKRSLPPARRDCGSAGPGCTANPSSARRSPGSATPLTGRPGNCPPTSRPPPSRSANNYGPTATRSAGCEPRTRNSATNSPGTSAPPEPQQPPQGPSSRHCPRTGRPLRRSRRGVTAGRNVTRAGVTKL
jgi:hypothetical protein